MANPQFVELDVRAVDGAPIDWESEVRVAVGLEHLRLADVTTHGSFTRLRFEGTHLGTGLKVAYFAFGRNADLAAPMSRIAVHRIAWR
jgi:hypothetical protein